MSYSLLDFHSCFFFFIFFFFFFIFSSVEYYKTVVPAALYAQHDASYWKNVISAAYLKLPAGSELVYRKKFVETMEAFQLFGHTFFNVTATTDSRVPHGGLLAIGPKACMILDRVTRVTLATWAYDSIVNFRFDEAEFVMKTGDLMNKAMLSMHTNEGFAIADLIQSYIQARVTSPGAGGAQKYNAF